MNTNFSKRSNAVSERAARIMIAAFVGAISALSAVDARAATDLFLAFPGVQGESTNIRHRNEIELKSFATSASNTTTLGGGGGQGAGRAVCGQVTVVKTVDRASPQLLGLMFAGRHTAGPVTVSFEKNVSESTVNYYKVDLFNVVVTSVAQNDSEADLIRETVTMIAQRFVYTYRPQNADGSLGSPVTTGWDCVANRRI